MDIQSMIINQFIKACLIHTLNLNSIEDYERQSIEIADTEFN